MSARDTRWGKTVKKEWFSICCICGDKGSDPHHIFPRGIQATKYIIKNGLWLCRNCHNTFKWMPDDEAKKVAIRFIGEETYNLLERIALGYEDNNGRLEEVR